MTVPKLAVWDPRRIELDHHVSLENYARGLRGKVDEVVRGAFAEVNSTLLTKYSDLTAFQKQRALELYARTGQILQSGYSDVSKLVGDEMFNLAAVEGEFAQELLQARLNYAGVGIEANTTRLTEAQLEQIARYPVQGAHLPEWWEQQGQQAAFKVKTAIQQGLVAGEGIDKIVRRTGLAEVSTRRGAQMLTRTAVTAISTEAQFQGLQDAGSDVSEEYQIVATLDDRTSPECQALDGQVFRWDDPKGLRPPFHLNCRTTIIAVVNWKALGVADPTRGLDITRASQGGPVTSVGKSIDYAGWLRQQPVSIQDDILGVAKGKLFRMGKASLADLVKQDGTAINLQQLQRRLGLRRDEMPTSIRSPASLRGANATPGLDLADMQSALAVDAERAASQMLDYAAMTDEQLLQWAQERPGFYLTRAGQIDRQVPGFKARVQRVVREFKAKGGILPPKPPPKPRGGPPAPPGGPPIPPPAPPVPPPAPPPIVEPPTTLPKLRTADDYRALTDKQVQLWASERQSFYQTRAAQIDKKLGTEFKARVKDVVKRMGFVEVKVIEPPISGPPPTLVPRRSKTTDPFANPIDRVKKPEGWTEFMMREAANADLANKPIDSAVYFMQASARREGIAETYEIVTREIVADLQKQLRRAQRLLTKEVLALDAVPVARTVDEAHSLMRNIGVESPKVLGGETQLWQAQETNEALWRLAKQGHVMPGSFETNGSSYKYGGSTSNHYGTHWASKSSRTGKPTGILAVNPFQPGYSQGRVWTQQAWESSHKWGMQSGFHPDLRMARAGGRGSTVTHEMGHFLHTVEVSKAQGRRWYTWWSKRSSYEGDTGWRGIDWTPVFGPRDAFATSRIDAQIAKAKEIAGRVSGYAQANPLEFVAETFEALNYGKVYDDEVMALYRFFNGPEVHAI